MSFASNFCILRDDFGIFRRRRTAAEIREVERREREVWDARHAHARTITGGFQGGWGFIQRERGGRACVSAEGGCERSDGV